MKKDKAKPMLVAVTMTVEVKYGDATEIFKTTLGMPGIYTKSTIAKMAKKFTDVFLERIKAVYAGKNCIFKTRYRTKTTECTQLL